MSTNKQQRRADKKRRAAQARQAAAQHAAAAVGGAVGGNPDGSNLAGAFRGAGPRTQSSTRAARKAPASPAELIDMAASLGWKGPETDVMRDRIVDALVDADGRAGEGHVDGSAGERASHVDRPESLLGRRIVESVAALWERGWQPADLAHVIRREISPRAGRAVVAMIQAEEQHAQRHDRMPESWSDQLVALGVVCSPTAAATVPRREPPPQNSLFGEEADPIDAVASTPDAPPLRVWRLVERLSVAEALDDGLRVLGYSRVLPAVAMISPPPSRWSVAAAQAKAQVHRRGSSSDAPPDGASSPAASIKALATIRALLAKAESSTFASEAEAFAAKAQELMTRYSIDAAVLDSSSDHDLIAGVRSRRFHLDNPYAKEKVELLSTVGSVNRVKIVFHTSFGMATAVGFAQDLELTDLLFTSLLVQASRALNEASGAARRTSSPSFKRGFWVAYAQRVGERLAEANAQAATEAATTYGSALVPVLRARSEAVDQVVDSLFSGLQPMKSRSVDAQGWYAGRAAADKASLGHHHGALRPAR